MHSKPYWEAGEGRLNGWKASLGADRSRPPHILILSVSAGTGHVRAAQAIELALAEIAPHAVVRNVDMMTLATRPFRFCYAQAYVDLIDAAPSVLGFFYNIMDRFQPPWRHSPRWDRLRISLEKMSMRPFLRLLHSEPWDLVINTHFLSGEIIGSLHANHRWTAPQVTVTTDFEAHRLWITPPCARYFVATEEIAHYFQCYGVDGRDVRVTGIPIHPVFAEGKSPALCRARQGLKGDRPIVLQLAGGCGVGPIEKVYRELLAVSVPIDLVVVAGRNDAARRQLANVAVPPRHRTKILGFTHAIDELMTAADLAVTKPGGLTTSEALASGLPLAIVHPVPGQEDRNSDYLLENGAAIKVNHVPTLAFKVTQLLRDTDKLARLKTNARRLGRPRAAFAVAEEAMAMVQPAAPRRIGQHALAIGV